MAHVTEVEFKFGDPTLNPIVSKIMDDRLSQVVYIVP